MVMSTDQALALCFTLAFLIIIGVNIVAKIGYKEWKGGGRDV